MKAAASDRTVRDLLALGGRRAAPSGIEMHDAIRRGLPKAALARVGRAVGGSHGEFAELLGVHSRTLSRLERSSSQRIDPVTSDRLCRVVIVIARATEVMGSADAAKRWLRSPQYGLGGAVPFSLMTSDAGTQEVLQLIGRIEHGILD